jgi:TonB family protein
MGPSRIRSRSPSTDFDYMTVRIACLIAVLTLPTFAQRAPGNPFGTPPRPKVVSTPTPAPTAKPTVRRTRPKPPADPLVAYMPTVKAAFSLQWGEKVTPLLKDFTPGNVNTVFKLDAEGKVTDFQITGNTSNEAFGKFCEQFVRETPFEKPPEKALVDGHVEIPFTFTIY